MGDSLSVRQGQNGKRNRYMQHPNLVCATSSCQTRPPLTLPEGNPAWVHSSSAMAAARHRQRRAASPVVLSRCILIHCGGRHTISFRHSRRCTTQADRPDVWQVTAARRHHGAGAACDCCLWRSWKSLRRKQVESEFVAQGKVRMCAKTRRKHESMITELKSKSVEIQIFSQSLIFQYTKRETAGLGYLIKARGKEEKNLSPKGGNITPEGKVKKRTRAVFQMPFASFITSLRRPARTLTRSERRRVFAKKRR